MGTFSLSSSTLPAPPPPAAAPRSGPSAHPAPPRLCSSLQVNTIPASFHDGLLLYVQAVTETLAHGGTVTDGVGITQRMWNRSFQGQGLEAARRGRLREPQPRARRWRPHTRLVPFRKVCPLPPAPPAPSPQLRQDVPRCIQPHSFPLLSACPFDVCLEGEQRQTIERWRRWGGWSLNLFPLAPSTAIFLHAPGVAGYLKIDSNGDRETDFSLWDMDPETGAFRVRLCPQKTVPPPAAGHGICPLCSRSNLPGHLP